MLHSDTFYVSTAANATEQTFTPSFKEKAKTLNIKRVFVNIAVAGVTLKVYDDNQQKCSVDCTRFAAGNEPFPLELTLPPQRQLTFSLTDLSLTARNNVGVTFVYDVNE